MKEFYSIGDVCGSLAGITALVFTDMSNIDNYGPGFLPPTPNNPPSFTDADKVYSIAFERHSGELTKHSKTNQGGDYTDIAVSVFVPRSRSTVDTLLARMRNRFMCIIAIDRYANQHIIYNALRSFSHTTGAKPGSKHGYQLSFSAPAHYLLPSIAGNGDVETAPPLPGDPGGGDPGEDCCISINPIGIAYTPTTTGNALNRNELVTTPNGSVFFIDNTGRSILLNRPAHLYYAVQIPAGTPPTSIVLPAWFWIPDPDDYPSPTYDTQREMSRRIQCIMATRELTYDHADGWYLDYATRTAHFNVPIDEAVIAFYSHQAITPIPL